MTNRSINYDALDPGIRSVVRFLDINGFRTTDSGDGVSKAGTGQDFEPVPHVHMVVPPERMRVEADRLLSALLTLDITPDGMSIQATYDPAEGTAVLSLYGVTGKDFA